MTREQAEAFAARVNSLRGKGLGHMWTNPSTDEDGWTCSVRTSTGQELEVHGSPDRRQLTRAMRQWARRRARKQ